MSDQPIATGRWVQVTAIYTGSAIKLYLDDVLQSDVKPLTGNVKLDGSPLLIGGIAFKGCLDEVRLSNIVRQREWVQRRYYYSGWRLLEVREASAYADLGSSPDPAISLGSAVVTRQFTDGSSIDEHLTQDVYAADGQNITQTLYYHESTRGDTVALTDQAGNTVMRLTYSAYGQAYKITATGALVFQHLE